MATRTRSKNASLDSPVVETKARTVSPPRASASRPGLMMTRNDLSPSTREAVVALCNARLADLLDLRSQVKQAHWNIKGPGFHALHELLDEIAAFLDTAADDTAERAVQLGGLAMGTARMVAASSTLPEYPAELTLQRPTLETVADRIADVAREVRQAIDQADSADDADTADLFTDISRALDKNLWFIEAHLHPDH